MKKHLIDKILTDEEIESDKIRQMRKTINISLLISVVLIIITLLISVVLIIITFCFIRFYGQQYNVSEFIEILK